MAVTHASELQAKPTQSFEDPLIAFEDPLIAFEDPLIAFEDPLIAFEDPLIAFEDPLIALELGLLELRRRIVWLRENEKSLDEDKKATAFEQALGGFTQLEEKVVEARKQQPGEFATQLGKIVPTLTKLKVSFKKKSDLPSAAGGLEALHAALRKITTKGVRHLELKLAVATFNLDISRALKLQKKGADCSKCLPSTAPLSAAIDKAELTSEQRQAIRTQFSGARQSMTAVRAAKPTARRKAIELLHKKGQELSLRLPKD